MTNILLIDVGKTAYIVDNRMTIGEMESLRRDAYDMGLSHEDIDRLTLVVLEFNQPEIIQPTDVIDGQTFIDTDTDVQNRFNGSVWEAE